MSYRPRRTRAHYLVGAPKALLAVYDNGGKSADRYLALYGEPWWTPDMGHDIPARSMSAHPSHPQGIGISCDVKSYDRAAFGKLIAFRDLPPDVQRCIVADCTEDDA